MKPEDELLRRFRDKHSEVVRAYTKFRQLKSEETQIADAIKKRESPELADRLKARAEGTAPVTPSQSIPATPVPQHEAEPTADIDLTREE